METIMNPVIGPTVEETFNELEGTGSFWRKTTRYKQAKPFDLVLPYERWELFTESSLPPGNGGALANAHAGHSPDYAWADLRFKGERHADLALAKARERFLARLGETSQLSTTLGEYKQSIGMITSRANQLRSFAQALKKGDIRTASKSLVHGDEKAVANVRKKYGGSRSLANQWLELHFGWVPLVEDIFNAVEVLQAPIPLGKVRVSAKMSNIVAADSADSPGQWFNNGISHGTVAAYIGAHVRVNNPNLYLANRLGIINPASLAWELTPWSFVVDWFTNVGQFIGQMTDTMGLTFENPWHGVRTQDRNVYQYFIVGNAQVPYLTLKTTASGYKRYQGFPDVSVSLKPLKGPSVVRAATAMSLLIQKLPKF